MKAEKFVILARRYKVKGGEIDLVCRKDALLVFLEVKYRGTLEEALYAITPRNQARIITAAQTYIAQEMPEAVDTYRFDVLAFAAGSGDGKEPLWRHIESAFEAF